jgi:hypothetical protein
MAFVMEIRSEVCGSSEGGVFASVEVEYQGRWLCCWRKYLALLWRAKQLRIGGGGGDGARYRGSFLVYLRVIKEIKSPCGDRGFRDAGTIPHSAARAPVSPVSIIQFLHKINQIYSRNHNKLITANKSPILFSACFVLFLNTNF